MIDYVEGGYKDVEVKFRDLGNGKGRVCALATGNDTSGWDSPDGEFYTSHSFQYQPGEENVILAIAENQLRDGETRGNGLGGDVNEAIAEAGWPDKNGFWLANADKSVRNALVTKPAT